MHTDSQYHHNCLREQARNPRFPGLAADAPVGRVEDWPDQTNAGAFVIDRSGDAHYILNSEIELDVILSD